MILDDSGNLDTSHHYLPFGEERPTSVDNTLSTKAFTGHERDQETGLDYMMARYYSSSIGRFMSPDDSNEEEDLEDPQSFNQYRYAGNNPARYVDLSGQFSVENHIRITWQALASFNLSDETMSTIVGANTNQDKLINWMRNSYAHGTGTFESAERIRSHALSYANRKLANAKRLAAKGKLKKALKQLGKGTHTIQDLVAHQAFPNWMLTGLFASAAHARNDENPSETDVSAAAAVTAGYVQEFMNSISEAQRKELSEGSMWKKEEECQCSLPR